MSAYHPKADIHDRLLERPLLTQSVPLTVETGCVKPRDREDMARAPRPEDTGYPEK